MSQMENGQPRLDQLPYYREYLEQILKPHVLDLVNEVRTGLLDRVWSDLVARMAEEQSHGRLLIVRTSAFARLPEPWGIGSHASPLTGASVRDPWRSASKIASKAAGAPLGPVLRFATRSGHGASQSHSPRRVSGPT